MHELSIAMALVETASEKAKAWPEARVEALHVRLGALSGVVREALLFSFDLAARGTPIEGARLEVEEVPLTVLCPRCHEERPLPGAQHLRCPVCAEPTPTIVRGRELELYALEIDEHVAAHR